MNRWQKGRQGERQAEHFLCGKGYTLLGRNFRSRRGEIDIIAEKDGRIVFVEVKNWDYLDSGDLEYAIDRRKRERILAASRLFLHTHPEFKDRRIGFDVILVSSKTAKVLHYEDAFAG